MQEVTFEIVYVGPEGLFRKHLEAEQGTSISEAMSIARKECSEFPKEAWRYEQVAIYGKLIEDASRPIAEGDRLEILRPLEIDPVEARRLRANKNAARGA